MKRRSFLGAILGGGAAATVPVAVTAKPKNPLTGRKTVFVRVTSPVYEGDRLMCAVVDDGVIDGWKAREGEAVHAIAMTTTDFFKSEVPSGLVPYHQIVVARVVEA